MSEPIPVIDLFAGPGGLGEGFVASASEESRRFRVENARPVLRTKAF